MKKYIAAAALAVSFGMVQANAQNLNPTVEVSNAYEGKMVDATKPAQKMAVPDSLLKFDLDFDYSVLSSPYKGGYDFSPYLLEMRPEPDAYTGRKFYLRMGAGYTMNPEFDLVWSPKFKDDAFKLNVYAQNRSYIGDYREIRPEEDLDENGTATGEYTFSPSSDENGKAISNPGYDMLSKAGVNGRYDFARSFLDFALGYKGINGKSWISDVSDKNNHEGPMKSNFNSAEGKLGIHSNDDRSSYFKYDASISYKWSQSDDFRPLDSWRKINSSDYLVSGEFGPVISETNAILVGVGMSLSTYSSPDKFDVQYPYDNIKVFGRSHAGHLYIAPHYVLTSDRMKLSAGVKLDMSIASKDAFIGELAINRHKGQMIYPDVKVDYLLIPEHLDAYASVTGGIDHNSYSALKEDDHFYQAVYAMTYYNSLMENSIERYNARIGVRGNIASAFRYDLSGGYKSVGDYRHSAVGYEYTYFAYDDAGIAFADLKYALDLSSVTVDGSLSYTHTNLLKNDIAGFSPSPLVGNISAIYNWKDRISAGVHADWALARKGIWGYSVKDNPAVVSAPLYYAIIPGFFNLGIDASFEVTRKLSVWLKGDNLLCQTIQRTPLYAEKGIKFTAGICVNL